jgi:regulatory protein
MQNLKIIKITNQVRRPERKTIYLDNGDVFGVSEDVLISYNLTEGQNITESDVDQIKSDEYFSKALSSAYQLLSYRMRSTAEMHDRLSQKGYNEKIVSSVVAKLSADKYLNDKEFALAFARDKIKSRKIGPNVLKHEFIPHRLTAKLVETAVDKVYEEFPVSGLIKQNIAKTQRTEDWLSDEKEKQKIVNRLKRKGFFWEDISAVIDKLSS